MRKYAHRGENLVVRSNLRVSEKVLRFQPNLIGCPPVTRCDLEKQERKSAVPNSD